MKGLYNPSAKALCENMLDINQVDAVQIETDGRTLWINIDGVCVLRVYQFANLALPDAEAVKSNLQDLQLADRHKWSIKNKNGFFTNFGSVEEALKYIPQAPHLSPFSIWQPGVEKPSTRRYIWDWEDRSWKDARDWVPEGNGSTDELTDEEARAVRLLWQQEQLTMTNVAQLIEDVARVPDRVYESLRQKGFRIKAAKIVLGGTPQAFKRKAQAYGLKLDE